MLNSTLFNKIQQTFNTDRTSAKRNREEIWRYTCVLHSLSNRISHSEPETDLLSWTYLKIFNKMLIFVQHSLSLACSSNIDQTPSRLPNKIAHPLEPSMIRRFNAPISLKLSLRRPGSFSFCVEYIQHTIQHIQQVLNLLNCWNCVEYFVECLLKLNKQCIQQIQQSIQHCWICWISVEKCVECCWMDSTKTGGVRGRPRDIFREIVALNLRFMDGFEGCAIFFRIRDGVWSMLPLHAREIFCWTEIQFCWISVE